jgi:uncharacterized membrane protein
VATTHLIALGFLSPDVAEQASTAVRGLADEKALELKDAAIVVRTSETHVELRQTRALAHGEGIVGGGAVGLLLGIAVGAPVAVAAIGMAGGGGLAFWDRGIDDGRMKRLGKELEPGHAALFALAARVDWALLRERLEPYGGELIVSEVDGDVVTGMGASTEP